MISHQIDEYLIGIMRTRTLNTHMAYSNALQPFASWMGNRPVDRKQIVRYFDHLRSLGLTENGLTMRYRILRTFFNWLADRGTHVDVPTLRFTHTRADRRTFTIDEYRRLLVHSAAYRHAYWSYAIVCAWHTGLRMSDIALLQWEQVDLDGQMMRVIPLKVRRFGKSVEIPLFTELQDVLAEWRAATGTDKYVSPLMAQRYKAHRISLIEEFHELCDLAGIEGRTFHCFRHTFISRLVASGTGVPVIASITGQSFQQVMEYVHVTNDTKREQLSKILS